MNTPDFDDFDDDAIDALDADFDDFEFEQLAQEALKTVVSSDFDDFDDDDDTVGQHGYREEDDPFAHPQHRSVEYTEPTIFDDDSTSAVENRVLGALLTIDSAALVTDFLSPEHFESGLRRDAYRVIRDLTAETSQMSPELVAAELRSRGALPADGLDRLRAVAQRACSERDLRALAERVQQAGLSREIRRAASQIASADAAISPDEMMAALQRTLEVAQGNSTRTRYDSPAAIDAVLDAMETPLRSVSTGIDRLDQLLGGGLQQNSLTLIAARPGVGKSTLGLDICRRSMRRGEHVRVYSFEMDAVDIMSKILAADSSVYLRDIRHNEFTSDQRMRFDISVERLRDSSLEIMDSEMIYVEDLVMNLRFAVETDDVDLVFIDYVQLMQTRSLGKTASMYERLVYITRELKRIAMDLSIPILCAAQLNRDGAKGRAGLAQLSGSGSLEQDADNVIILTRERSDDIREPHNTVVQVEKARRGTPDDFEVHTQLQYSRFGDFEVVLDPNDGLQAEDYLVDTGFRHDWGEDNRDLSQQHPQPSPEGFGRRAPWL